MLPFPENGDPTQACLESLKQKELKQGGIIFYGYAPFFIVIGLIQRISHAPTTPVFLHILKIKDFGSIWMIPGSVPSSMGMNRTCGAGCFPLSDGRYKGKRD
jgi:hypothetical protein